MEDLQGDWKVPNEILCHILLFVSNRTSIKLTCKKLYELTCTVEKYLYPLKITIRSVRHTFD